MAVILVLRIAKSSVFAVFFENFLVSGTVLWKFSCFQLCGLRM